MSTSDKDLKNDEKKLDNAEEFNAVSDEELDEVAGGARKRPDRPIVSLPGSARITGELERL